MEVGGGLHTESTFQHIFQLIASPTAELDAEHSQKAPGAEQAGVPPPQVKLKDRQKFFEEAFQQDMEQYLTTGYLQIAERREPIGSMSSMEVNVDMLEQMDLMDMSDHEALDVFLHSGGEDNSAASPDADVESFTTEISLQVPTQAELRHKLSSLSSTCTDSASQDTEADEDEEEAEHGGGGVEGSGGGGGRRRRKPPVVVTLDEEEVHPDTALVDREAQEQTSKDCEGSRFLLPLQRGKSSIHPSIHPSIFTKWFYDLCYRRGM
uniref:Dystrobrevin binding protein 1b n=1 Tax=Nothobranchius furzeri TaxID=105023 RepID=A0A8C6M8J0_NOTFU